MIAQWNKYLDEKVKELEKDPNLKGEYDQFLA